MTIEQYNKLDKCHFNFQLDQHCQEEVIDARDLLGPARFDLYAILLYIDQYVHGVRDISYAKSVYKERTRAITGFSFSEDGNSQKNSFEDYLKTLNDLIDTFRKGEYDDSKRLIPVDKDYVLIDGAHRVSCAAYFGKKIKVLRLTDLDIIPMTSSVLMKNLLPEWAADAMALEASKWHKDLFMLFLWPKSFINTEVHNESLSLIHDKMIVMYEKEIVMTYQAIRNLMIQIYGHMDWVGTVDNNFASTFAKADEVWEPKGKCRFILAQGPSTDYVLELKGKVRDMFNIGLASMHSTDNQRETLIASNAIFNPNSLHFLKIAQPAKYKKSYKLFEEFKQLLDNNGLNKDAFIIDSSMVLAISGGREAADLDYYALSELSGKTAALKGVSNIEEHDDHQKQFYDCPIDDLINNVSNYFVFNEIKFVSLEKLMAFKKNRYHIHHDAKDSEDIKLISILLSNKDRKLQRWAIASTASYRRYRRRLLSSYYLFRNNLLKRLGLYDKLKQMRDNLRK